MLRKLHISNLMLKCDYLPGMFCLARVFYLPIKSFQSPIPSSAKATPKTDSETRRKLYGLTRYETVLSVRLLAEIDSSFTTCQGFILHYKIRIPSSPRSLSSTTFIEPSRSVSPQLGIDRIIVDRSLNALSKSQTKLCRSYSNQFDLLYDSLLENLAGSAVSFDDIPPFNHDAADDDDEFNVL